MKSPLSTLLFVLLTIGQPSAQAQTITIDHGQDSQNVFTARPPIRVQESFTLPLASAGDAPAGSLDQAIASARQELYRRIQQECAALSQNFSADCRISNFSINIMRNNIPLTNQTTASVNTSNLRSVDAIANYELKLKE